MSVIVQRAVYSICKQVDKHLFQLIRISMQGHDRSFIELHHEPLLQQHHALQKRI